MPRRRRVRRRRRRDRRTRRSERHEKRRYRRRRTGRMVEGKVDPKALPRRRRSERNASRKVRDAFDLKNLSENRMLPTPDFIGPYVPMTYCIRDSVNFQIMNNQSPTPPTTVGSVTNTEFVFIVQWCPGDVRYIMIKHQVACRTAGSSTEEIIVTPMYADVYSGNAPIASKPMRMAMRLRNTTALSQVQGFVRVCASSMPFEINPYLYQGLSSDSTCTMSTPGWYNLVGFINAAPSTRTYACAELTETMGFVNSPCTENFHSFYDYTATARNITVPTWVKTGTSTYDPTGNGVGNPADPFVQHRLSCGQMPMGQFLFYFPCQTGNAQSFDFTLNMQDGARFPTNTVLGRMAQHPPQISSTGWNTAAALAYQEMQTGRRGAY